MTQIALLLQDLADARTFFSCGIFPLFFGAAEAAPFLIYVTELTIHSPFGTVDSNDKGSCSNNFRVKQK